jgi:hypothetical protein
MLLVIYCTFNTRILIFEWRHVSVLIYHLQAIFFQMLPTIRK